MRRASAPGLFVGGLAVVAAVAALTAGVVVALGLDEDDPDPPASGDAAATAGPAGPATPAGSGSTTTSTVALAEGQVAVTGVVTAATVERAVLEQVPTPMQVTAAEGGGAGGATVLDVQVDGRHAEIVWDGGRPFALYGEGLGILPQSVDVHATPTAVTVAFSDGEVHGFVPGVYELRTPVAVGAKGVARPVDSVRFVATVESTISFRGLATTSMLPRSMALTGTGRVRLEGEGPSLQVRRFDGTVEPVAAVELPDGPFELTLTPRPDGSGYDVSGVLEGAASTT